MILAIIKSIKCLECKYIKVNPFSSPILHDDFWFSRIKDYKLVGEFFRK